MPIPRLQCLTPYLGQQGFEGPEPMLCSLLHPPLGPPWQACLLPGQGPVMVLRTSRSCSPAQLAVQHLTQTDLPGP